MIWEFANGKDISVVEAEAPPNKGYGNSTTIAFDVTDAAVAKMVLLALSETVSARLRKHNVKAEVICVGIKDSSLCYASHQMTLTSATDITAEIHAAASRLLTSSGMAAPSGISVSIPAESGMERHTGRRTYLTGPITKSWKGWIGQLIRSGPNMELMR